MHAILKQLHSFKRLSLFIAYRTQMSCFSYVIKHCFVSKCLQTVRWWNAFKSGKHTYKSVEICLRYIFGEEWGMRDFRKWYHAQRWPLGGGVSYKVASSKTGQLTTGQWRNDSGSAKLWFKESIILQLQCVCSSFWATFKKVFTLFYFLHFYMLFIK